MSPERRRPPLWPIALCSRSLFGENLFAASTLQRIELKRRVLILCRDTRIADQHAASPKTHAQHSFSEALFQETVLGEREARAGAAMANGRRGSEKRTFVIRLFSVLRIKI